MLIREINALNGPNYWSIRRHKLIVMVLDLEAMEDFPSNKVEGFVSRVKNMFPSLYYHRCSENCDGGFFKRLDEGTWMGHVVEHLALELQTLAGMDTGFGRTRGYGEKGVYNVVFSYIEESVGRYAAKTAVRVCEALIAAEDYDIDKDLQKMRELRENERLGPSTESIVKEAESRGIPWLRLNKYSLCQLGYGSCQKRIRATVTSETSSIGVELACDKEETNFLLGQAEVPVPKGMIITRKASLKEASEYIGYPLVIKPVDGNHGRGITVDIENSEEAAKAFEVARKISSRVIVEKFIEGEDYRLLVINHKLVAAARREPAHVIGDGQSTIEELVQEINNDPRRGFGHEKELTIISLNELTQNLIAHFGYTVDSILPEGQKLVLKDTANLSTGGTAVDVTHIVHPANVAMAERISRIIDLDICGIDVMSRDISLPLSESGGMVLEVNACPGFRMHLSPAMGLPRNVAAPVVDKLFPKKGENGRIPIVAITGTNGKTTTSRLIAHMAKMHGFRVGYTTSDGVYIQNRLLMKGDCTGPRSTEFVLRDPTVNFAVLECARGGLLRAGLGFKRCDVGIVTNVAADHLGLKGINTIQQLAKVKAVIPETVLPEGYAVLNADDDLVYAMGNSLECNIALFSMAENNPRIMALQKDGGITAIYENGYVTLCRGIWKMRIMKAENIPLTYGGKAHFMIQNILPSIIASYISGIGIDDIKVALESFNPSASQSPGRLNLFKFNNFSILLDYAHNPSGMRALKAFTDQLDATVKVGIISGIGDRRVEDNREIGSVAAEMFDEIIIRQDRHLRGRSEEELIQMLEEGIRHIAPDKPIKAIPVERDAIMYAIANAEPGCLIVLCSDVVSEALELVKELKEKEAQGTMLLTLAE